MAREPNPVSWLNDLVQSRRLPPPVYQFRSVLLEDFRWKVTVKVQGAPIQAGFGRTKKLAQRDAAAAMLRRMAK